jgi:hypothetical protein
MGSQTRLKSCSEYQVSFCWRKMHAGQAYSERTRAYKTTNRPHGLFVIPSSSLIHILIELVEISIFCDGTWSPK